ncbi:hypothetical protein F5J12DRAFT_782562 [Pisolithus orientalis]|uniref:uncharacterized protein n=1 Tax=Pisolithus orientalis TaxID=936130 RepID=UPI0022245DDC|nr:uncharacterized protein F5J12DRAFT_782562 [Pisolithus orientalis]KAI6007511.1 hypothetical protein F5J12DRAFT_782562 [Pisolithus orientalis]
MPSHALPKASFGKLEVSGEGETKVGTIVEDRAGTRVMSPSISSPIHPIPLIIMRGETVGLTVRSTLATAWLKPILRPEMCLFKAPLADERYVRILTKALTSSNDTINWDSSLVLPKLHTITRGHPVHVEMDQSNTRIQALTAHVGIVDPAGQASLSSGCAVTVEQLSLNTAKLHVDQYQHTTPFPPPVDAINAKFRVARKLKYVEVDTPMTLTLHVKGGSELTGKFRTAFDCGAPTLWNMHCLSLGRCPSFGVTEYPTGLERTSDLCFRKWSSCRVNKPRFLGLPRLIR